LRKAVDRVSVSLLTSGCFHFTLLCLNILLERLDFVSHLDALLLSEFDIARPYFRTLFPKNGRESDEHTCPEWDSPTECPDVCAKVGAEYRAKIQAEQKIRKTVRSC
jgi:hypothetical protein